MLSASDLRKTYPSAAGPLEILRGVTFSLERGQAAAITGPSGCGKSTLLYLLGSLEEPTGGTVTLNGTDPFGLNEAGRATFRNNNIGFVFQDHHLLPQCTVLENVLVPLLATRSAKKEDTDRAEALLDSVGLADRRGHRPAALSGGERQRTALCRALINEPAVVLADEPTGNLDPATAETVGQLLLDVAPTRHVVLVCVTHSMKLAEQFEKRLRLEGGRLTES